MVTSIPDFTHSPKTAWKADRENLQVRSGTSLIPSLVGGEVEMMSRGGGGGGGVR